MTDRADGKAPGGSPTESFHVFLVRLWTNETPDGHPSWCGKVQHVTSGEAHTFRDWPALVAQLQAMLPDAPPTAPEPDALRAAPPADSRPPLA